MAQVINEMDVPSHSFVFHGTGERYFLICVVNVLLTIITLGIYLPWALMKCKRYLYANMEVNGQRFSYGITGGNVFVREGANKQVISSQVDSLIKISRIWADF
ncbi:DUF898 family protein, partial [Escherichia coli]|uniref:DUF898 family protein n=1 Tax=Escherichia coli TaxID=562 RepID=UPI001FF58B2C